MVRVIGGAPAVSVIPLPGGGRQGALRAVPRRAAGSPALQVVVVQRLRQRVQGAGARQLPHHDEAALHIPHMPVVGACTGHRSRSCPASSPFMPPCHADSALGLGSSGAFPVPPQLAHCALWRRGIQVDNG